MTEKSRGFVFLIIYFFGPSWSLEKIFTTQRTIFVWPFHMELSSLVQEYNVHLLRFDLLEIKLTRIRYFTLDRLFFFPTSSHFAMRSVSWGGKGCSKSSKKLWGALMTMHDQVKKYYVTKVLYRQRIISCALKCYQATKALHQLCSL